MFFLKTKKSYRHLNRIVLSSKQLLHNHRQLQRFHPEAKICPVLKSNAYGHGLREVAPLFDLLHTPFLVVDSLYEAYELAKLKVKTRILILGYTDPHNFTIKRLPFDITVFDLAVAQTLNLYQPGCRIHLFVDTGMGREGISMKDLPAFLSELKKLKNLQIVGLCSHFADVDNPDSQAVTNQQITQYKKALSLLHEFGYFPQWRHSAASGGSFKIHDETFTMIRAGLAHYGISPLATNDSAIDKVDLKPILSFHSTVVQIKGLVKGESIGYNHTYTAKKDLVIGLLPAGYYEGIDRRLSNVGVVKIRNSFYPIVGRVSMNMTVIDISGLKNPRIGEDVIIYSDKVTDPNAITTVAKEIQTIPYEILVHLAGSMKRIVIHE